MRRRAFIAGLGGAAAWPVLARGQQPIRVAVVFISAKDDGFAAKIFPRKNRPNFY